MEKNKKNNKKLRREVSNSQPEQQECILGQPTNSLCELLEEKKRILDLQIKNTRHVSYFIDKHNEQTSKLYNSSTCPAVP